MSSEIKIGYPYKSTSLPFKNGNTGFYSLAKVCVNKITNNWLDRVLGNNLSWSTSDDLNNTQHCPQAINTHAVCVSVCSVSSLPQRPMTNRHCSF